MKFSIINGEMKIIPPDEIRFVGEPTETNILSSEGETYFVWTLKKSIRIDCSTDINFQAFKVSELYLRESALRRDDWEGSLEDGLYISGWIADYSKRMGVGLYQQLTILQWLHSRPEYIERIKEQRGAKRKQFISDRNKEIREGIQKQRSDQDKENLGSNE